MASCTARGANALWLLLCLAAFAASDAARDSHAVRVHFHERDKSETTHRPDWAYPIAALNNRREGLVRIYGQYLQDVVGNNTEAGEVSSVMDCFYRGKHGGEDRTEARPLRRPIEELSSQNENNTPNYIIDCEPAGDWATEVVLRIHGGVELGRWLKLTEMASERQGDWAACSQPLHTDREFLKAWVEHQFKMGADKVFLHAPRGPHVDELFDEAKRHERIKYNAHFAERSADNVGHKPLHRFERENVEYFDYWPSPTASYYAEEIIFTVCHYRNRYAYNYSTQFDIDEFWVPAKQVEQTLPEFLRMRLHPNVSEATFFQVYYPMSCATHSTGDYLSRFTLFERGAGQAKPAVRSFSVRRMHVHGMLDTSPEWQQAHPEHPGPKNQEFDITEAFLKHVRPDNFRDETHKRRFAECKFGPELDAEGLMGIER